MPLRLALMVAIGALLALGACSSDTKTVTAPADPDPDPAPMQPDPDPDPAPTPTPTTVMLPAGAADDFPTGDTPFTIRSISGGHPAADVDRNGNRFVDMNGYRFICRGEDACTVTVTKSADGMLSVDASANVLRGEVAKITMAAGVTRFLQPSSGNRQQFSIAAGGTMTQNGVVMSCPAAASDGCVVVIETRLTDPADADSAPKTDTVATGGVTFASAYPAFYRGLAYQAHDANMKNRDPLSLSLALSAPGFGAEEGGTSNRGRTISFHTAPATGEDVAPPTSNWGNVAVFDEKVAVAPTAQSEDSNNVFAGFADGTSAANRAKTYGAVPVRRGLGLVATATAADAAAANILHADYAGPYDAGAVGWIAELPVDRTTNAEGTKAFSFAGTDMRSPADRFTMGIARTIALDGGSADDASDDGTLHIQAFTNYETDKMTDPAASFGDVDAGALTGQVLVAPTGGVVPDAPADRQTIGTDETNGTFNGVPGVFTCSNVAGCVVTTDDDGAQTLTGGSLAFTPTEGAQVVTDDADWLAFGSWAVAMDGGHTAFGAFIDGGDPFDPEGGSTGATLLTVQGQATYNGVARGHYAEHNDGMRDAGVFGAVAKFVADYGSATDSGTGIYGTLRDFSTTSHGSSTAVDRSAWEIDFASESAKFAWVAANHAYGFGIAADGKWGAGSDNGLTGSSAMQLFGNGENSYDQPTGIAGTFFVVSDPNDDNYDLSLIGAFGATR